MCKITMLEHSKEEILNNYHTLFMTLLKIPTQFNDDRFCYFINYFDVSEINAATGGMYCNDIAVQCA